MRYFQDAADGLGGYYNEYGYLSACCGAYQAVDIDDFKTSLFGLTLFVDKVKHVVLDEEEYKIDVVEHGKLFFHIKRLVTVAEEWLEKDDWGDPVDAPLSSRRFMKQSDGPYHSVYIEGLIKARAGLKMWQDRESGASKWYDVPDYIRRYKELVTRYETLYKNTTGYVCYIYTNEQLEDAISVINEFDVNSELVYTQSFINNNYVYDPDHPLLTFTLFKRN